MWLQRGVISPTRHEQLSVRKRALFSVVAIFQARLARQLIGRLGMMATPAVEAGVRAEEAARPGSREAAGIGRVVKLVATKGGCGQWPGTPSKTGPSLYTPPSAEAVIAGRSLSRWTSRTSPSGSARTFHTLFSRWAPFFSDTYRECKRLFEGGKKVEPRLSRARS
jgi:hypothetical protein